MGETEEKGMRTQLSRGRNRAEIDIHHQNKCAVLPFQYIEFASPYSGITINHTVIRIVTTNIVGQAHCTQRVQLTK